MAPMTGPRDPQRDVEKRLSSLLDVSWIDPLEWNRQQEESYERDSQSISQHLAPLLDAN